jgi:hypothetical protein
MGYSSSMWNNILIIFSHHVGFYAAGKIAFYHLPKLSNSLINELKNKTKQIEFWRLKILSLNYNMIMMSQNIPLLHYP